MGKVQMDLFKLGWQAHWTKYKKDQNANNFLHVWYTGFKFVIYLKVRCKIFISSWSMKIQKP
jgi:hypothetical protein